MEFSKILLLKLQTLDFLILTGVQVLYVSVIYLSLHSHSCTICSFLNSLQGKGNVIMLILQVWGELKRRKVKSRISLTSL